MKIDKLFFASFGGCFDADVIDWKNPKYFEQMQYSCANGVIRGVKDLDTLIAQLTEVLEKWTPELVMPFIDSTNFNWYDSPELEQTLKEIIQTIISEIEKYQMNLKN